jgi:capsular exopolysaccharide synthesis family protein
MSHLHNLFHNTSKPEHVASPPFVQTVPENLFAFAKVPVAAPGFPEFPVEEALFKPGNRLVYYEDPRSPAADRFRLLGMRLKDVWSAGRLKKLLITGPLAHNGKSVVVLNLATALAEGGKRTVLVVEADLHHPSLGQSLRVSQWAGLAECLVDEATPPFSAIRRIEPLGWYLLPAGSPRRNPTELLQTPALGHVMQQLSECFDWILVDSPPVIPLTDSLSLQRHADASLLVVRADQTPREAVEETITLLGKKNILGIVLNGVESRNHLYYQYYGGNRRLTDD